MPGTGEDTGAPVSAQALSAALVRVASGDHEALGIVYRASSAKLFGVCLRILKDRNESEDVLQEVYLTVWRRADGFDPERGSAMAWLGTLARNRAIDRLRARRPMEGSVPIESIELADDAPSTAKLLETAGEVRRMHACLEDLEGPARVAIRTAFLEGVTYEALSRRMDAPLGTVKSWVRRGLIRLRACLEA